MNVSLSSPSAARSTSRSRALLRRCSAAARYAARCAQPRAYAFACAMRSLLYDSEGWVGSRRGRLVEPLGVLAGQGRGTAHPARRVADEVVRRRQPLPLGERADQREVQTGGARPARVVDQGALPGHPALAVVRVLVGGPGPADGQFDPLAVGTGVVERDGHRAALHAAGQVLPLGQAPKSMPAARARAAATAVPRTSAAPGTAGALSAGAAASVVRSKDPAAE